MLQLHVRWNVKPWESFTDIYQSKFEEMHLHSAANDFSVLQGHRDASLGDWFLMFLDHHAVRHQLLRDAVSCPRRTDTSKWIGIQDTPSSAGTVTVPAVSRVDYILINIFANLRSYGQSVKLATRKITFPSASYMGDPRFKSRTGEGLCLIEKNCGFLVNLQANTDSTTN